MLQHNPLVLTWWLANTGADLYNGHNTVLFTHKILHHKHHSEWSCKWFSRTNFHCTIDELWYQQTAGCQPCETKK